MRLDELLALQGEIRRLQVCIRGLAEAATPTPAPAHGERLRMEVSAFLEALVGRAVPFVACYRVGRATAGRPRPIIVAFAELEQKVEVLRHKGRLYRRDCPPELLGVRVYHDLSPQQLEWKFRLKRAYDGLNAAGVRVIWRAGYRLLAREEDRWEEYVPE